MSEQVQRRTRNYSSIANTRPRISHNTRAIKGPRANTPKSITFRISRTFRCRPRVLMSFCVPRSSRMSRGRLKRCAKWRELRSRAGGLFLTAPLGSGLHQEPYHFYGDYTDHWYRKFLAEFGCDVVSIEPNHGFFAHLGQECARFRWQFDRLKSERGLELEHGGYEPELSYLIADVLPRYFYQLDREIHLREFTVGFHVEARRKEEGAGI